MIESIENMGMLSWLLLFTIYLGLMVIGGNVCILAFNAIDGWAKLKRLKHSPVYPEVSRSALEVGSHYFRVNWNGKTAGQRNLVLIDERKGNLVIKSPSVTGEWSSELMLKFDGGKFYGPVTPPWRAL